jgi:hypothetical protein
LDKLLLFGLNAKHMPAPQSRENNYILLNDNEILGYDEVDGMTQITVVRKSFPAIDHIFLPVVLYTGQFGAN